MERNLSLCFKYEHNEEIVCSFRAVPDPKKLTDEELCLTINACIRGLTSRHGLEQALSMANDAAYGKLGDGSEFDTRWVKDRDK